MTKEGFKLLLQSSTDPYSVSMSWTTIAKAVPDPAQDKGDSDTGDPLPVAAIVGIVLGIVFLLAFGLGALIGYHRHM